MVETGFSLQSSQTVMDSTTFRHRRHLSTIYDGLHTQLKLPRKDLLIGPLIKEKFSLGMKLLILKNGFTVL